MPLESLAVANDGGSSGTEQNDESSPTVVCCHCCLLRCRKNRIIAIEQHNRLTQTTGTSQNKKEREDAVCDGDKMLKNVVDVNVDVDVVASRVDKEKVSST